MDPMEVLSEASAKQADLQEKARQTRNRIARFISTCTTHDVRSRDVATKVLMDGFGEMYTERGIVPTDSRAKFVTKVLVGLITEGKVISKTPGLYRAVVNPNLQIVLNDLQETKEPALRAGTDDEYESIATDVISKMIGCEYLRYSNDDIPHSSPLHEDRMLSDFRDECRKSGIEFKGHGEDVFHNHVAKAYQDGDIRAFTRDLPFELQRENLPKQEFAYTVASMPPLIKGGWRPIHKLVRELASKPTFNRRKKEADKAL